MNRFGYRTRIRFRAVGVEGAVPLPPPPIFWAKIEDKRRLTLYRRKY